MRSSWTREELVGYDLVWIATMTYAGQTWRMATVAVELDEVAYPATMAATSWRRKVSLFDGLDLPDDLGISGWVEGDLVELARRGHRLRSARMEVAQVRVRPDRTTPDTYARRRVLASGILRDVTLGTYDQGHTFVSGSVHMPWPSSTATIPPATHTIDRTTWQRGAMADSDEGVSYPVIIGYPGRDDADDTYQIPAMRAAWISRARDEWQVLCVGSPRIKATTVRIFHTANPEGWDVNVSDEYSPYLGSGPGTPIDATDTHGVAVSVVDYKAEGYSETGNPNEIDPASWPSSTEASDPTKEVYVGLTAAGGGGLAHRGEVLRGAGGVLAWALELTGWPVDWGRTDAARALLDGLLIDAAITERIGAVDWLQGHLLPLLPVTLRVGGDGIYPLVWRRPTPDAVVARLDVDTDLELVVGDHTTEDDTALTTIHTLRYGYDRMRDRHRYTVRVGPEDVASTDRASCVLLSQEGTPDGSGEYGRVYVTSVEPGISDIQVVFTVTAGAASASDNPTTRVVTVDAESGSSTAEQIADLINTGCTLVTAVATDAMAGGFSTASRTGTYDLKIQDFGTAAHPACTRSDAQQRDAGIVSTQRRSDLETYIVYDHPTARAIVDWRAEVHAQVRRRLVIRGPTATLGALELLDVARVTAADLGIRDQLGWVEEIEEYTDGQSAVTMVFLG